MTYRIEPHHCYAGMDDGWALYKRDDEDDEDDNETLLAIVETEALVLALQELLEGRWGPYWSIGTVWATHSGDELGGTPQWFFWTEHEARMYAQGRGCYGGNQGRGWYGVNATVSQIPVMVNRERTVVYWLHRKEPLAIGVIQADVDAMKVRALAKLTAEERKLLGLGDT